MSKFKVLRVDFGCCGVLEMGWVSVFRGLGIDFGLNFGMEIGWFLGGIVMGIVILGWGNLGMKIGVILKFRVCETGSVAWMVFIGNPFKKCKTPPSYILVEITIHNLVLCMIIFA